MEQVKRRDFLMGAVAASGVLATGFERSVAAADTSVEILPSEPIGTISPNIYGHFVEHLGGVVYDGIWVGGDSKIANVGGIRAALIDALKRIRAPLVRYPGGCFADSYDWRDGVGERSTRPRRTNFWNDYGNENAPSNSKSRFEPNEFGTNEFLRFCRLTGAKPYLAANLRSLTAQDFYNWVEYCNSPARSTTFSELRESGPSGSREPFGVEYWGIGNESWGCGGNLTPQEYAQEYRRFTAAVPEYKLPLKFVGAGANSDDLDWTRGFFSNMREKRESIFNLVHAWGIHHYSWNVSAARTDDWKAGKGDAVRFDTEQYYELLREADKMDRLISEHWKIMGEFDTQHRVKIAVDEWGTWHRPGTELKPDHTFGQQNTMRDALVAALTLDTFNRHADKVVMGNIAQLVNCLQSLFLTDGDKFLMTPTYHVFEMFMPHMSAQSVRTVFNAPRMTYDRNGKAAEFWGLNGSASVSGKRCTLTVTNPHHRQVRDTEIAVRGATVKSGQTRTLTSNDLHARNSFEQLDALRPKDATLKTTGSVLNYQFPPASITRLVLDLD